MSPSVQSSAARQALRKGHGFSCAASSRPWEGTASAVPLGPDSGKDKASAVPRVLDPGEGTALAMSRDLDFREGTASAVPPAMAQVAASAAEVCSTAERCLPIPRFLARIDPHEAHNQWP